MKAVIYDKKRLAGQGNIRLVIDRRYTLEKTSDAVMYLNEGHAMGKVVILVD